jgi:hypothetical protein
MKSTIKGTWKNFLSNIKIVSIMRTAYSELCPNMLISLFSKIEREELKVQYIYVNPDTYVGIRKWGKDVLDFETSKERQNQGYMAKIWGAIVAVSETVPDNVVLVISEAISGDPYTHGAILNMDEEIEGITELVNAQYKLNKLSKSMQEQLDNTTKLIQSLATKTERVM